MTPPSPWFPCVDLTRHHVYVQNVTVCTGTTRGGRGRWGDVETHVRVVPAYTETFWMYTRRRFWIHTLAFHAFSACRNTHTQPRRHTPNTHHDHHQQHHDHNDTQQHNTKQHNTQHHTETETERETQRQTETERQEEDRKREREKEWQRKRDKTRQDVNSTPHTSQFLVDSQHF